MKPRKRHREYELTVKGLDGLKYNYVFDTFHEIYQKIDYINSVDFVTDVFIKRIK